jgi:hypothetical protein
LISGIMTLDCSAETLLSADACTFGMPRVVIK